MKTITSILLLFIILVQTFAFFVYDAAYYLNKNYIAENLCVNKDKPATHCEGHCYLKKQQEKEQGGDKHATENKKEKIEFSAYELPAESIVTLIIPVITPGYNGSASILLHGHNSSIFHPPLA